MAPPASRGARRPRKGAWRAPAAEGAEKGFEECATRFGGGCCGSRGARPPRAAQRGGATPRGRARTGSATPRRPRASRGTLTAARRMRLRLGRAPARGVGSEEERRGGRGGGGGGGGGEERRGEEGRGEERRGGEEKRGARLREERRRHLDVGKVRRVPRLVHEGRESGVPRPDGARVGERGEVPVRASPGNQRASSARRGGRRAAWGASRSAGRSRRP